MHYERFLFTRNQGRDFTAFVRPAALTNKDVSTIGDIFNYVTEVSRLTRQFPSLYCLRLDERYFLLLRHYNSGRRHAGRAVSVIEGIAVEQTQAREFASALPQLISEQDSVLAVSDTVTDIEAQAVETSPLLEWKGVSSMRLGDDPVADEFLARIDTDRLFLPFNGHGLNIVKTILGSRQFASPLLFAFGTNADVLAQLDRRGIAVDIVSFFNTDAPSYRDRQSNQKTGEVSGITTASEAIEIEAAAPSPSMAIRATAMRRADTVSVEDTGGKIPETEADTVSIRAAWAVRHVTPEVDGTTPPTSEPSVTDEDTTPVPTIRQMRDAAREERREAAPDAPHAGFDPLRWLWRAISSLVSPKHK